jgi:hypothetical protein
MTRGKNRRKRNHSPEKTEQTHAPVSIGLEERSDKLNTDDPRAPKDTTSTKPCVACRQPIPSGSSLCSVCKSYQDSWRNQLQYFAGIATLVALTVSALFWVIEKTRSTFFSREDVVLVACDTLDTGAVIVNRGDKEVFISHVLLWMAGRTHDWSAPRLTIDERLEPGQFLKRNFPPARFKTGEWARGLSPDDFEKLIVRASNGDPCTEAAFFSSSDRLLAEVMEISGSSPPNTFPVGGYLEFWGQRGSSYTRIPVTGIGLIRQSAPPCPAQDSKTNNR